MSTEMTQDELARVPSGGAKFKLGIRRDSIFVFWGKNEMLECYSESAARQIVGSVNAAILAERVSDLSHWGNQTTALYDARTCLISEEAELMEANFRFWLDYAKGNA